MSLKRYDVLTIFPAMLSAVFGAGVVGRGVERGLLEIHSHDLRDFTHDRHRQVDDAPFGGGAGMVLKPEPIFEAVEHVRRFNAGPVILMEPWGERLTQELAAELAAEPGPDAVVNALIAAADDDQAGLGAREVSIGDYVLSGAEIPAMVLVDAVARLVPGVVGDPGSLDQDSFTAEFGGFPQFTRPAEYRGMKVPDVLLTGDHRRIRDWRVSMSRGRARS